VIKGNSLSVKIILLALLNVLLLGLVFLLFARLQFRFELSSFLLAPARERILSVSRLLALQLPDTPAASWTQVLQQYSSRYPAELYLFDIGGHQLAGKPVELPEPLMKIVRTDPFPHIRENPPPHPPDDGPIGSGENGPPPRPSRGGPREFADGPPPPHPPEASNPQNRYRGGFHFAGHRGLGSETPLPLIRTTSPLSYWVAIRIPIWTQNRGEPIHAAIVWKIRAFWTELFYFDYRPWLMVALAVIAVSVLCWVPLIRGLTRAIKHMTAATGRIADGHFEVKLPVNRRDELGKLSQSINRMTERLSGYVFGQKRFLGDIAHELSSPIARIQVGLGILEQHAGEEEAPYVEDVREEVEHMSRLVNELLAFSKSQAPAAGVSLIPVNLAQVVEKVLEREGSQHVLVNASVDRALRVLAQPDFLFRALANVVRNAIRYAGDAGPVDISAMPEGEHVKISVSDRGPGIPDRELENVFRPFYRPEFARQRETGGTGLGLAIVRDCVESCGGAVYCRNRAPSGLEVIIRLAAAAA
jgi:two-component system sensor histidine kinase CpxA